MERLGPGQVLVAQARQGGAAPGVLDPGPGQGRVEVVAAVHEHGAGFQLLAEPLGGVQITGPDRRAEAIGAVVHQGDGLGVAGHRHDADHRAEAFLAHHRHLVVDLHQHLRRQVGRAGGVGGEATGVDQCLGAAGGSLGDLPADELGGLGAHQRAEGGGLVQRVAQHVLAGQLDEAFDEGRVELVVDVDALDAAAALPGVEEAAVDQVLHRVGQVGIGAHVGRVLATQLQADADEVAGGGAFHHPSTFHRAGEVDLLHLPGGDQRAGLAVVQHQVVEQPVRQAGAGEGLGEALADQQGLAGVLEQYGVTGHQRRDDGVHRRQVGIVPRRHHQHGAQRLAANEAAEAFLRFGHHVGQGAGGDADHVARALLEAAQLAGTEAHRAAHLPGQFGDYLVLHCQHGVHRLQAVAGALFEGQLAPGALGLLGLVQDLLQLVAADKWALGI